jgi:proteasome accessory factor B
MPRTAPKIQRWIDLLAALLRHHYLVSFEQLIREVPAYAAGQKEESRRRTFERDKDELRRFGVPIETVPAADGELQAYRLRIRDFYLPCVQVADLAGTSSPQRSTAASSARTLSRCNAFPASGSRRSTR